MTIVKSEKLGIRAEADVVSVRQAVRKFALEAKFSLIDQTKIVTAASELARNTVIYGKGGDVTIEVLDEGYYVGIRLTFEDQGPGIADINLALRDGYTSGNGMGLGLGGSKRLVNEFSIQSVVGTGTKITLIKWNKPK